MSDRDTALVTERLLLEPVTVDMIDAAMSNDWTRLEVLANARGPSAYPGPELFHRGFGWSIERIRRNPEWRLWGDRLMITRVGERRIVGSVVFHGHPDEDGVADIGYGVDDALRGRGIATEATLACIRWALDQPAVLAVTATIHSLNVPSQRVAEKVGMTRVGSRDEPFGELLNYAIRRADWIARDDRDR